MDFSFGLYLNSNIKVFSYLLKNGIRDTCSTADCYPRSQDFSKISVRYLQDSPKIPPRIPQDLPKISLSWNYKMQVMWNAFKSQWGWSCPFMNCKTICDRKLSRICLSTFSVFSSLFFQFVNCKTDFTSDFSSFFHLFSIFLQKMSTHISCKTLYDGRLFLIFSPNFFSS